MSAEQFLNQQILELREQRAGLNARIKDLEADRDHWKSLFESRTHEHVWTSRIKDLEDEVEKRSSGVHSCHKGCKRHICVQRRRIEELEDDLEEVLCHLSNPSRTASPTATVVLAQRIMKALNRQTDSRCKHGVHGIDCFECYPKTQTERESEKK